MILNNFAKFVISFALYFYCFSNVYALENALKIDFYGQEINLTYDESITKVYSTSYGEAAFIDFLKNKEESSFQSLINQMQALKQEMNLNDWMYFELMHSTINHMLQSGNKYESCLLYTSPSPRDRTRSRMPSSA